MGGLLSVLVVLSATPNLPIPLRLPAEVEDVYSLRFNPAGLGYMRGGELRALYGRRPDTPGLEGSPAVDGLGLFAAWNFYRGLSVGTAFEADFNNGNTAHRFSLGLGLRLGSLGGGGLRRMQGLSFGLSFENLSPFVGEDKQVLNAGVNMRWARWLSTGVAARDLLQTADRRQWDLGLAIRPFGERFLVSSRWRLRQSQALNSDTVDLTALASWEVVDGISFAGSAQVIGFNDPELTVSVQLGLALERFGINGFTSVADNDIRFSGEVYFKSQRRPSILTQGKVAVVTLEGALKPDDRIELLSQRVNVTPYGAAPLLLEALTRSGDVSGVLVRLGPLGIGWAKAREIRKGLLALKEKGRVDCYLSGVDDLTYFVASACTTIMVPPPLNLSVDGLAAETLYFADALDQLGVKVEVVKRGRYKSSPEQYTRSGMSAAQQEALGAYIDTVFETLVAAIAKGRKLPKSSVEALIELGTLTATEAQSRGLVDQVLYPDQIEGYLKKAYGRGIRFRDAPSMVRPFVPRWKSRPKIALIHIDGAIAGGDSTDLPFGLGRTIGARTVVRALEAVRADPQVKAVVLRIDSPGGSAFASDLIARAVARVRARKPVVASFGDVAASGGYYVGALAQTIFAEPTTLTGSIGVFSLKISAAELMGKLGIGTSVIKRGSSANAGSFARPQTPEEQDRMAKGVDDAYQLFLRLVADGRKMPLAKVKEVAQGRIWSGQDAMRVGLVDEIGGLLEAIERAKALAGLEEQAQILTLPNNRSALPEPLRPFASVLSVERASPWNALLAVLPKGGENLLRMLLVSDASVGGVGAPMAMTPVVLQVR